jgi:oxygen-independent coproporphyrinogen-3 oxidase
VVDDYLSALFREMEAAAQMMQGKKPDTIYIGGGTPTTLNEAQLKRLIDKVCETFDISGVLEFTVEGGRPDSITKEKLETLKSLPVTRISINPQTMQQRTLDLIGRRHTVEDTVRSFQMARDAGFDNINMDLIVGLPQETVEDVADTLRQIEALAPDNLTVHSLALKRAARLSMNYEQYKELSISNTSQIMDLTAESAKRLSMEPYYLYRQKNMAGNFENVGYAAAGKAGIYNILIMEEKQTILALGAGATTKYVSPDGQHIERAANVKDIGHYLERVDEMIVRKRELFEQCGKKYE